MEVIESQTVECYHCGEECDEEIIRFDEKAFCCSGCKSVYQILREADLCEFYNLEEKTGRVKNADSRKYVILDDAKIARDFIEFEGEGLAKTTFFAPGIHCSSCIWLLEHLNQVNPAVIQSTVNFLKKEVSVTFRSDEISLKEVALLLDAVGYPPQIEKLKSKKKTESSLIIRLAVAGFCFGNSMLISLPDYLDLNYQIPEQYRFWFGYINLLFAIPVFFYSATVYFKSAWKGLKHKFINIDVPISLGIITLFIRSLYEITIVGGTGYVDSLAGLVFFLLIGRWYQHKTYQALSFDRDLSSYFPVAVTKIVEGKEVTTRLQDLKEGDTIFIRNQELIPADGIIVSGKANIDYSFVTGESIPTAHKQGELLYAGGRQLGAPLEIKLNRTVNNSHLTKLWNSEMMMEVPDDQKDMTNISDQISRYFTAAILIIAMAAGVAWVWIDPSKSVDVFTAILIVACPCALALSVPFSYGHTLRVFGKHGFYLKNANIIERISKITSIVFDKTGTLTKTLPENVTYIGEDFTEVEKKMIYSAVSNSVHPLSKILKNHLKVGEKLAIDFFEEIPGKGIFAVINNIRIRIGSGDWIVSENQLNTTRVYVEVDRNTKGYFEFSSAYRDNIFDMLEVLKTKFRLSLLSGDTDSEKEKLNPYFDEMHFKQTPEEKLHFTDRLRCDNKVMMVGDGLNDAGALKQSDVGISISDDIYQFSPACDGILNAKEIGLFPNFIRMSKSALNVVYLAFAISFAYNIVGLSFAILGKLTPLISSILMPISSVTVVGVITIAINLYSKKIFKAG